MIFYLASRIICSTAAFAYPGYKSYKALSRRNVDEQELERWLMYWSVMGFISAFEYVAEWLISWIPFYYLFKTAFLLFLALPQTQGSTFIYSVHLAPLLTSHEDQIDSLLTEFKLAVYTFLQEKMRNFWVSITGQPYPFSSSSTTTTALPDAGAINPPTAHDPLSGAAQWIGGWWTAYAPAVMATVGTSVAGFVASRQQQADQAMQRQRRKSQMGPNTASSVSRMSFPTQAQAGDRNSVLARRRQLEAELAALQAENAAEDNQVVPETPITDSLAGESTATSSSSSLFPPGGGGGDVRTRGRTRKDSSEEDGEGRYENVNREDVDEDDGEGYARPPADRRSSWWWSRTGGGQGYDRVKAE